MGWLEFLVTIFQTYGIVALIEAIEVVAIIYLFRLNQKKQEELLAQSERRLEDVIEEREKYQELASDIEKSIDLLVKVLKKNGN
jgi:hypothetical protein